MQPDDEDLNILIQDYRYNLNYVIEPVQNYTTRNVNKRFS